MSSTEKILKARIQAIDNFTKPMQNVIKQTKTFQAVAKAVKPVTLRVKDLASKVINKAKVQLDKFKKTKVGQIALKIKDMASAKITSITSKIKSISSKAHSFMITAKDKASPVIESIKGKLKSLGAIATVAVALVAKGGIQGLGQEQTQKLTISRVIENTGKTKAQAKKTTDEYYKYLTEYANKTPFETSAVAQFGTKAMMMSKGNVDQAKQLTDMMGNVKAFVGDLRTEQEVAEAFFSVGNGNIEMLNNMLGTQYKSFEDAKKGIAKNQGGLVEEMSTTIPGLMSTIVGKTKDGMKNFVKAFTEPLANSFSGLIGFIDNASKYTTEFAQKIGDVMTGNVGGLGFGIADDIAYILGSIPMATKVIGDLVNKFFDFGIVKDAIRPIVDLFSGFTEAITTESPVVSGIISILGTTFNVAWGMIKTAVEIASPFIEKIFNFLGENAPQINNLIKTIGVVWDTVWKTVGPLLQVAWTIVSPILSSLLDSLSTIGTMVQNVGKWWQDMASKVSNNPIVAKVSEVWDNVTGKGKKSAFGTARVTGNDVPYRLHDGERVLTKGENKRYEQGMGNSVVIQMNATVREEADINKIATALVRKLNDNKIVAVRG